MDIEDKRLSDRDDHVKSGCHLADDFGRGKSGRWGEESGLNGRFAAMASLLTTVSFFRIWIFNG
jgi:hypothetical protein